MAKKKSNPAAKDARAAAWKRGEERKAKRNEANKERAAANRARRANGQPTPWQEAKAARAARRAELPRRARDAEPDREASPAE